MGFNEGAFDAFDTVFCAGPHIKNELLETEKVYNLKSKKLVEFGFPLLDNLVKSVKEEIKDKKSGSKKEILIAPSWQEDNLLDSCIDGLIEKLYSKDYHITVRPHPEYVKRYKYKLNQLVEKYKDYDEKLLTFELDFSSNKSIYSSDLLITDWSGISAEFAFATGNPVVFVNTKMKVCNQNWQKIEITPIEIKLRDIIGVNIEKEDVEKIDETIKNLFKNKKEFKKKIEEYFETFTYNHGTAAEKGAKYILQSLIEKKKNKKEN